MPGKAKARGILGWRVKKKKKKHDIVIFKTFPLTRMLFASVFATSKLLKSDDAM